MRELSWIIPALPLTAFALIVFFTHNNRRLSSGISIAAIATGFVYSIMLLLRQMGDNVPFEATATFALFPTLKLEVGIWIDALTAIMLVVVTLVSMLVQIYSLGYMHGDPRFSRFYAYLSLFTFSMLGLVLANNFFLIFCFWELVGLTSYLLIGFWFEKKTAADAGKKAFITTRVGDFGFMIGVILLAKYCGTLNYQEIFAQVGSGVIPPEALTIAGIGVFCGAIGKSAQFPLHVWLPDAMEGPTPVSALIHAATMVAAGVYLVARSMTLYVASPDAALFVASIGIITSLLAASIALVQNDIKRILAYSTVSQLGYMIMALGLGAFTAGTLHLMTHAFFKACLFLCAGSVIHAAHTQDIQQMGGLRRKMPVTYWTMLIATLSIAGIFPLSGFWSKDEIVAATLGHPVFMVLTLLVAFMTSFYMFRLIFLTFVGETRDHHSYEHAHESPKVMTWPLIVLAVLSVCAGWVAIPWLPHGYSSFAFYGEAAHHGEVHYSVMFISTLVALCGIGLAYLLYVKKAISPQALGEKFKPIYTLLYNKWYFDEIYSATIVNPVLKLTDWLWKFDGGVIDWIVNAFARVTVWLSDIKQWFDQHIVDGAVNGLGYTVWVMGALLRQFQTGKVQLYGFFILFGIVLLLISRVV